MKDRIYTVSQDKNGYWYVHKAGYPHIPCFGTFHKQKKICSKRRCYVDGYSAEGLYEIT